MLTRTTVIVQRLGKFLREAATEKGEADRILKVKAAEGDAQSKALQGRGIADQRQEIGASSRTNAILIPHSPGHLASLTEQMRNAMIEADQTVRTPEARARTLAESTIAPTETAPTNGESS